MYVALIIKRSSHREGSIEVVNSIQKKNTSGVAYFVCTVHAFFLLLFNRHGSSSINY